MAQTVEHLPSMSEALDSALIRSDPLFPCTKYIQLAGCYRWLTPVILPTWEAEIMRMEFRSQPGQIIQEILSQKYPTQKRTDRMDCLKW
jgi:hypothetical protein